MHYLALACDYDGTIAEHGTVDRDCIAAIESLRSSGRRLILITGRQIEDLIHVLPLVTLFDRIVAENGALLYCPATYEETVIGKPPPPEFIEALKARGVPSSLGKVIVSTWEPYHTAVLETIRNMGLVLQVIFNKGAVIVLPSGVNKATGLKHAPYDLALSPDNVVGIGDAENDHEFLSICECSVAVSNALPALKNSVDLVTEGPAGKGVVQLIQMILASDLREMDSRLKRHRRR